MSLDQLPKLNTGAVVHEVSDYVYDDAAIIACNLSQWNIPSAMIGYGLFSVARLIFVAVCSRKKVQDNTNEVSGVAHDENVCERQNISIRKCLVAQLPLAFTIIAFAAVFIVYNTGAWP